MARQVHEGRWTVVLDGDVVVFLIGARVGNPLRAVRALPLLARMQAMLTDLARDSSKGLLAFHRHGGPLHGVIVQYWRSFEALEAFARDPQDRHAATWREWFRKAQHRNAAVGIWHETFLVPAGRWEAIYQNMAPTGIGKAGRLVPVGSGSDSARLRAGVRIPAPSPAPPVEQSVEQPVTPS